MNTHIAAKAFALLCMLVVPLLGGTAAAQPNASNDGALSVKNADGRVVIVATRGGVIGRFDRGQVTIKDPNPNDGTGPIVTGADTTSVLNDRTTRYSGSKIRFRIIGGAFTVNVFATNIDLSAIGRGMATLDGTSMKGNADNNDGTYAVNADPDQPFPDFRFTFPLAPPLVGPGG